ncbi:MAG: zinc ribbon domain-containing protein [Actinobacteria bacterium]|nr:zinc ribbon domain-containing protein [Actinomycetota bacterium]
MANEYRWALIVGGTVPLLLAVVGVLGPAIMIAAFLLPVTFLVYAHDVELWEERPALTLAAVYLVVAAGASLVSLVAFRWMGEDAFAGLLFANAGHGALTGSPTGALILFGVALPVASEIVRQVGPVILARLPAFDDMIDGFTFGVASGAAYAAFETVVAFGAVFTVGLHSADAPTTWVVVILNLMIVKPVIYGAATGMAVAAFSGRGEGYDGFTPAYFGTLGLAIAANVAYWLGVRLLAGAPFGQALALLWGAVIAAVLVVRARVVLQAALLEAAVEDAARNARPRWATTDLAYCPECENALLPDALFCIVCGASVRATSIAARRHIREPAAPDSEGER